MFPSWVTFRKGKKNQFIYWEKRPTIEIREDEDIRETREHEFGHALRHELTFGKFGIGLKESKLKPHYSEAERYAKITYNPPNADEGWAQSYADFKTRPDFLKKHSPSLYRYWKNVVRLNKL